MIVAPYTMEALRMYEGRIIDGETEITVQECALSRGGIFYLKLENPDKLEDETANAADMYYGSKSRQRHRLIPGQSTEWFPVRRLEYIWVRAAAVKTATANVKVVWSALV